ncbi:hypothetical protein [Caldimonas brevitalea]|uniref:Condensation domain-containing protein n=1 Tax=Caldimonas brevitalea TaxID=413882 RepID=A0A0G3BN83_9BURK|nr:hypothetical protein [Caldimonas brevitalea]AKJ30857.1 hypothetical protein AAW51_4166 [Caldimonas brevitalea]
MAHDARSLIGSPGLDDPADTHSSRGAPERWRPMSSMCRLFLHGSEFVNANSACLFVLNGTPDEQRLRQAAVALLRRHPLLRSMLARKRGRIGWQLTEPPAPSDVVLHWHKVDDTPLPQLMERAVNHAWEVELPLEQRIPFALAVFETPRYSLLQIITSHVAEDAYASYLISHDLAQAYANPAVAFTDRGVVHPPAADMDSVVARSREPLGVLEKLKVLAGSVRDLAVTDTSLPVPAPRTLGSRGLVVQDMDESLFAGLRAAARASGTTVHSVMLLALCRVILASHPRPGRVLRLLDMYSMRGQLGPGVGHLYENLVLPYTLRVERGSDCEMLAQIYRRTSEVKAGGYVRECFKYSKTNMLLRGARLPQLKRWMIGRTVQARVLVTNPGQIPFDLPSFGELEVMEFFTHAQVFPPGSVMCQFSGFRGRVRMILLYDRAAFGEHFDELFRGPYLAELQRMANAPQALRATATLLGAKAG